MDYQIGKSITKSVVKNKEFLKSQAPKDEINAKIFPEKQINDKNALSEGNKKNKSAKKEENINKDELPVSKDNNGDNALKIELFPENKPKDTLEKKKIQFLVQNAVDIL